MKTSFKSFLFALLTALFITTLGSCTVRAYSTGRHRVWVPGHWVTGYYGHSHWVRGHYEYR
ncbi:hypothetical protein [Niabella ginsenosidivorans]|uniref:hypothetical protein n=1 Tax=Niabella ginsenosidivorans TaxID=1176587 RepID=UPI0008FC576F|nr:hypothetical protein [Niabella ginsenosidivorans]